MAAKRKHPDQMEPFYGFDEQQLDANKRSRQQDSYCWLCHRNQTNVNCSTCIRSYHQECIGKRTQSLHYQCETCNRLNLANSCAAAKFTSVEHLNRLLVLTTKRLLDDQEFNSFNQNYYKSHEKKITDCGIVNPIHLDGIDGKVRNSEYGSTIDFMNDIKWICHNINIMDDPDNKHNLRIAKRLEKFVMKEMYDIEMCHQCYFRSNTQTNWFTEVCSPPHLLVWARVNNQSGYAPAKVLGLNGSTAAKKIDVRFFADHEMACVAKSNCYLFSKRRPSDKNYEQTKFKQVTALQEVGIYVGNIRKIFSSFVKAEYRTQFNERKIVNHLKNMIPELRISKEYHLVTKPSYLNRLVRRHAPIVSLPNDDDDDDEDDEDDNSTSNEDKKSSPQEKTSSKQSTLNPVLILEKCDPLIAKQQQLQNFNLHLQPMNVGISEEITCEQAEQMSEGEADMDLEDDFEYSPPITHSQSQSSTATEDTAPNGQNSVALLSLAVTPKPQNRISETNGQYFTIARKKTDLLNNFGPEPPVKTINNVDKTVSTRMQPSCSQTNESQTQCIERLNGSTNRLNANQVANSTGLNVLNQNNTINLPVSTRSKPSDDITTNCDWEELLDKFGTKIRKRQRNNRKMVLKREKSHLMNVNRLKSMVNVLKKKNRKLHTSMHEMEGQHTEHLQSMVQKAIEETKCKKWCWNCHVELKYAAPMIAMCTDCFNKNCFGNGENMAAPTPTPAPTSTLPSTSTSQSIAINAIAQNENTTVNPNLVLVEQSTVNEHQPQQMSVVDQLLADLNEVDPLLLELEGF